MKNILINITFVFFLILSVNAQKELDLSEIEKIKLFETSEEIVPLRKTSRTIGKCCQLGKAMSKLTGGMSDVYLTQSELNEDGSYTVFFVSAFMIGFDTELTQYGVENPTAKILRTPTFRSKIVQSKKRYIRKKINLADDLENI